MMSRMKRKTEMIIFTWIALDCIEFGWNLINLSVSIYKDVSV